MKIEEESSTKSRKNVAIDFLKSYIPNDNVFYKYLKGKIVCILGTPSAGKTSITNNLMRSTSSDFGAAFIEIDAVSGFCWKKLFLNFYFGGNKKILFDMCQSDIIKYILLSRFDICTKELVPTEHRSVILSKYWKDAIKEMWLLDNNKMEHALTDELARRLIPLLASGNIVIADTIKLIPFFRMLEFNFIKAETRVVMAYCSPSKLFERILKRNQVALSSLALDKFRLPCDFSDFLKLYVPHQTRGFKIHKEDFEHSKVQQLLSIIDKSSIPAQLKVCLSTDVRNREQESMKKKKQLFARYFRESNSVRITPLYPYDLLINTEESSPQESSDLIRSFLK